MGKSKGQIHTLSELSPPGVVGEFACMTVVDTTSFGAFLDWGLEKHLLVPADEMSPRLRKGERHVVKVCLDPETQRVYATARIEQNLSKYKAGISQGDGVDLLIYRITEMGYQAIINNSHSGMLYKADTFPTLSIGDKTKGFIPCHDKTSPDLIRETFAMSKKEFKRSIALLYRERQIEISSTGITRRPDVQDEADHSPISPD